MQSGQKFKVKYKQGNHLKVATCAQGSETVRAAGQKDMDMDMDCCLYLVLGNLQLPLENLRAN